MKKIIFLFIVSVFIISLSANVFAGGGKVRGDDGLGKISQEHINIQYPGLFD